MKGHPDEPEQVTTIEDLGLALTPPEGKPWAVCVARNGPGTWRAWLSIGVQHFKIAEGFEGGEEDRESKEHCLFHARMIQRAMRKLLTTDARSQLRLAIEEAGAAFAPLTNAAREELAFIKSYLSHQDQDADHGFIVRRINDVLAGRDPSPDTTPSAVEPKDLCGATGAPWPETPPCGLHRDHTPSTPHYAIFPDGVTTASWSAEGGTKRKGKDMRAMMIGPSAGAVTFDDAAKVIEAMSPLAAYVGENVLGPQDETSATAMKSILAIAGDACTCTEPFGDPDCPTHGRHG